jgi:hypothetical protein
MFRQLALLISLVFTCLIVVQADQMYIYSPPRNALYSPKDIMDLRYKGKTYISVCGFELTCMVSAFCWYDKDLDS